MAVVFRRCDPVHPVQATTIQRNLQAEVRDAAAVSLVVLLTFARSARMAVLFKRCGIIHPVQVKSLQHNLHPKDRGAAAVSLVVLLAFARSA